MFDGAGDGPFDFGGRPGDVPLVWNWGRGQATTVGVYRHGTWMVQQASSSDVKTWQFGGSPKDVVFTGDWTGDGTTRAGVLRDGTEWVLDINGEKHFPFTLSQ